MGDWILSLAKDVMAFGVQARHTLLFFLPRWITTARHVPCRSSTSLDHLTPLRAPTAPATLPCPPPSVSLFSLPMHRSPVTSLDSACLDPSLPARRQLSRRTFVESCRSRVHPFMSRDDTFATLTRAMGYIRRARRPSVRAARSVDPPSAGSRMPASLRTDATRTSLTRSIPGLASCNSIRASSPITLVPSTHGARYATPSFRPMSNLVPSRPASRTGAHRSPLLARLYSECMPCGAPAHAMRCNAMQVIPS